MLNDFIERHGWHTKEFVRPISASHVKNSKRRMKTGVITTNYPI